MGKHKIQGFIGSDYYDVDDAKEIEFIPTEIPKLPIEIDFTPAEIQEAPIEITLIIKWSTNKINRI